MRLERPPIGTFNARDLGVLACFIVTLPVLYLASPPGVLTGFLVVTFFSALMIALRPLLPARRLLVAVPALLDRRTSWSRATWATWRPGCRSTGCSTSLIVAIAAVGVAEPLRAGRASGCATSPGSRSSSAVYDIFFTRVIPLTPELAVALQGRPLDPSIGFAAWGYNANVGLGDLLVFCLYTTAAYKRLRPPRRDRLARASSPSSARSRRA